MTLGGHQLSPKAFARLKFVFATDDPTNEISAAWSCKELLAAHGPTRCSWLADIIWWVQSPADLCTSKRRDPQRPRRQVHVDKDGNVSPAPHSEPPQDG